MLKFIKRLISTSNFLITFGLILITSINYNKVESFKDNTINNNKSTRNNNNYNHSNYYQYSLMMKSIRNSTININKYNNMFNRDRILELNNLSASSDVKATIKTARTTDNTITSENLSNYFSEKREKSTEMGIKNYIKKYNNDYNDDGGVAKSYKNNIDQVEMDIKTNRRNILSRKRRYLTFPEGSSLQVVFDQIIPIVDYTNYLILGITVALAWELPSKPPSEIIEDLRDKLNEGVLSSLKPQQKDKSQLENDHKNVDNYSEQGYQKAEIYHDNDYPSSSSWRRNDFNYYNKIMPSQPAYKFNNNVNWKGFQLSKAGIIPPIKSSYFYDNYGKNFISRYDSNKNYPLIYGNFNNSYLYDSNSRKNPFSIEDPWKKASWSESKQRIKTVDNKNSGKNYIVATNGHSSTNINRIGLKRLPINLGSTDGYHHYRNYNNGDAGVYQQQWRKHRIYPVFGKRSTDSHHELTKEDRIHLRYHRSSRHSLYLKIEKYLHTQGINGSECILKTLCETGQKLNETIPGSFIGEIMRTIFTLPQIYDETVTNDKHRHYDEAHSHKGDCNKRYLNCPKSLWNDFIL